MIDEPVFVLDQTRDTATALLFLLNNIGQDAEDQGLNRALISLLAAYTSGRRHADRFLVADREWLTERLGEIFGDEAERKLADGGAFLVYVTQQKAEH